MFKIEMYLVYSVDISKVFITDFVIPVWITVLNSIKLVYKEVSKNMSKAIFVAAK